MRILSLILVGAMILAVPAMAEAISLSVSAKVTSGTSLGTHTVLACNGYSYDKNGDPWSQFYAKYEGGNTLAFGGKNGDTTTGLVNRLYNSDGEDIGGAGCFYAANFFIVYLYPDAWGGKGYELKQQVTAPTVLQKALVFTPVYSADDRYDPTATVGQGDLTNEEEGWNPDINVSQLAHSPVTPLLILKAKRGRIVRAEYGIPPYPGEGDTRPTDWEPIPLETPTGTFTTSVSITLTEWQ